MKKIKDITGCKFGRLTAIELSGGNNYVTYWLCVCECGTTKKVSIYNLLDGKVKSCGCAQRESVTNRNTSHNMTHTRTYRIWKNIKNRTNNSKQANYKYYGARGITMCDRWLNSFENFLEDMGECPEGMSIDRINNEGNYEPNNCRWTTSKEQNSNKRSNLYITIGDIKKTVAEWSRLLGIHPETLRKRKRSGWSDYECLFGKLK